MDHRIEYLDRNCLFYRLTNSERTGRYRIVKQVLADLRQATIAWSADHWATANKSDTMNRTGLNLWFADLAPKDLPDGSVVEFTFFWKHTQRWAGRNWQIDIEQR